MRLVTLSGEHGFVLRHGVGLLTGVIPVGLFSTLHLWMNTRAMQGRLTFEATVVPALESPLFGAFTVTTIFAPLMVDTWLRFASGLAMEKRARTLRLEAITFFGSLLFILGIGYLLGVRLALGQLDAFDVHPEWCAALSSTNALGIPLAAMAYLAGLATTSHRLATGLRAFWATFRAGAPEPLAHRAAWVIDGGCTALFVLSANGVLYFASGAPLF